jgi:outer membrane receptor protein involved in Fe transport
MGVAFFWLSATAAAAAQAPPPAPATDNPETIIVTGERAKRSLKDTPTSVTVFDRHDIVRLAAPDRIQQLLQQVPNVLVPTSREAPVIRGQASIGVLDGLPAFLGGARPRTVLQIDGRTVTFGEFTQTDVGLWDVDHVEVFLSPQTTTQGVNSIGGAIFIHTADPTFTPEGRIRAIIGQSRRRQLSAVVSTPLVGDELALRVSGDVYRSVAANKMSGPVVGVSDINRDRYWTGRAKLLAQPHGLPGLRVLATYTHVHSQAPQGEFAEPPYRKRRDRHYRIGYIDSLVDSLTTVVTYDVSQTLQSQTTLSSGWTHYRRLAPVGFGQTNVRGTDRSFESVLDWKPGTAVNAIGGVAYKRFDLDQFIDLHEALLGTGTFKDSQPSEGVFGELTWHPARRLSVTAGARYQRDSKRRTGILRKTPELPLDYDKTSSAFLPKLSIAYDLSDDARVGVLAQRAYNPGGVTLDPENQAQVEFKPEYMWDYEAFTRASLLHGRLSVTGNLFFNAIRDAQREFDFEFESPAGPVGLLEIISEPKARAYGGELSVTARPLPMLDLNGAIGVLHTRIVKGSVVNDPFENKGFFGAPKLTATGGFDWRPVRNLQLSTQVRRVAGFAGDDANTPIVRTKGFWIADARASWGNRRLTVFGYVQNLFNTFQIIGWAGPRDIPDLQLEITDPREIGIGIEKRF